MFWDGWPDLARAVIVGTAAYAMLITMLRVSGKRTLSKLNAFDLIVSVALGSTMAAAVLNESVSLSEGITAFIVLIGLQYIVAWSSSRIPAIRRAVKSEPSALLHRGELLHDALRRNRVSPEEVRQAVRAAGLGGLELVEAVVLETDGSLSVIARTDAGSGSALQDRAIRGSLGLE